MNAELRKLWETSTGIRADSKERLVAIDSKIGHIRCAVEDGLNDANWANTRLQEHCTERATILSSMSQVASPPQLDAGIVMDYRRQMAKAFKQGLPTERKRLLRAWVKDVVLKPENLHVSICYRLPEAVMNGVVAGFATPRTHS